MRPIAHLALLAAAAAAAGPQIASLRSDGAFSGSGGVSVDEPLASSGTRR